MRKGIAYHDGYKYQLAENYTIQTPLRPERVVSSQFILLTTDGRLFILGGYAWDGPSGPVSDVKEFMRASLVHDALYQLMREGLLPQSAKPIADELMKQLCLEDGMAYPLAEIAYQGVEHFGYSSCAKQTRPLLTAP